MGVYLFRQLVNNSVLDLNDRSDVIGIQLVHATVTAVVVLQELEVEVRKSREALADEQDDPQGYSNAKDYESCEAVVQAQRQTREVWANL